jgi:N-acetylmuramoyl-L-alanine amidase
MPKIIVLDEGHGGIDETGAYDPGAVGNNLQEADLTADLAIRVQAKLAPYDVNVQICPRTDSLKERADFANKLNAEYFCSIHINAGGGTGFESYVYTEASGATRILQDVIHGIIATYLTSLDIVDRGRKQKDLAVLRETNMSAILLECLFIDSAEDAARLKDDIFLDGLANEIAWALAFALGLEAKQRSATEQPAEYLSIPIAGTAIAPLAQAQAWARSRNAAAFFVEVAPLYWELAPTIGVRADVAYAQAAKETAFGKFGGVIEATFHNFCGLKTAVGGANDAPDAHMRFPDDRTGVLAHLQHLAAYAGVELAGDIVDPRYKWVNKGCAPTVEQLGGKWAPNPDYGNSIVRDYLTELITTEAPVQTEPTADPCANCAKCTELLLEKSKLFDELSKARQIINQAKGVLAAMN